MLDEKSKGRELTIAPEAPQTWQIIDLMKALKESIEREAQAKSGTRAAQAEDGFVRFVIIPLSSSRACAVDLSNRGES
jgi:hypothetical protein